MLENIKNILREELGVAPFRLLMLGDSLAYLEGAISLKEFSKEKISVRCKCVDLEIIGENLAIKSFCQGDVAISGKINSVARKPRL